MDLLFKVDSAERTLDFPRKGHRWVRAICCCLSFLAHLPESWFSEESVLESLHGVPESCARWWLSDLLSGELVERREDWTLSRGLECSYRVTEKGIRTERSVRESMEGRVRESGGGLE